MSADTVLGTTGAFESERKSPFQTRMELLKSLRESKRYAEALVIVEGLLDQQPGDAALLMEKASLLAGSGKPAEALETLDQASQLTPDLQGLDARRGLWLIQCGRSDEAEAALRRSIKEGQELSRCYYRLGLISRLTTEDLEKIHSLLADERITDDERITLNFALGGEFDRNGQYGEAFAAFAEANRTRAKHLRWDRAQFTGLMDDLRKIAEPSTFRPASEGHPSQKPVFVTGLPRSGTTLVEQILASHPEVYAGGERDTLTMLAGALRVDSVTYPAVIARIPKGEGKRLGMRYLSSFPPEALDYTCITDKLPGNILHGPLIRLMFPKAPIIHCRRHPMDICLSMYTQHFTEASGYLQSLTALAEMIRSSLGLMDHLQRILPTPPLEVFYEKLIQDLDAEARRLVAHAGLPWDDRCLSPHKTARPVRTASMMQVRQEVYGTSAGRWRNYATELEPARAILADAIEIYEARLAEADVRVN
jgi:tetratricopeptide (TPR) repeat protein